VEIHLAVDRPRTALELDAIGRESRLISLAAVSPGDYTLELGASLGPDRKLVGDQPLQYLRQQVLTVSRAMGWNASDSVGAGDPNDLDAVHAAMRRSRAMGFDGSAQLYPRHVAVANAAFAPSEDELEWAADIIQRFERIDPSRSVAVVEGRAIVPPVYEYACRIREYARALEAGDSEYRVEVLP
jgi:citrate lyase beta subunit